MSDTTNIININTPNVIDSATNLFQQGRYDEANAILLRLIELAENTSYLSFCVGRNYLYGANLSSALEWLERSCSFASPFIWSYYELGRLFETEGNLTQSARQFVYFLDAIRRTSSLSALNYLHREIIIRVAHKCFEIDKRVASTLYHEIKTLGLRDYLSELRVVEQYLEEQRISEADLGMRTLVANWALDPWGKLALARLKFAKGDTKAAAATVLDAASMQPEDGLLTVKAGHQLLEFGMMAETERLCETNLTSVVGRNLDLDGQIAALRFRLQVASRAHAKILDQCRSPGFLERLPNWLAVEALLKFALPGEQLTELDMAITDLISEFLMKQPPYSLEVVVSLYQHYNRRRQWEKIADLDDRIRRDAIFNHHDVILRRFDNFCAMSRMQDAKEIYLAYYASAELSQWEACAVLRFLAESKMWADAGDLLRKFIGAGYSFPGGEYFLLTICRRTALHRVVVELIDHHVGAESPAQFPVLRELLLDDLAIHAETLADNQAESPPLALSSRNRILRKVVLPVQGGGVVGYLCADKAYFMSVLTFLASMVAQGGCGEAVDWHVFLARDVPPKWRKVLAQFGARIGLAITPVAEEDFVDSDAIHIETYGIFTGGSTLSRAAFLRIYAARYLFNKGSVERAYYVDSDIIANGDFMEIVNLPFHDELLMARAEETNPEVCTVAKKHGLADKTYFNSGVLAFDFTKEEISEYIDRAITLSEHESDRLVFHDQCALNIAFAGKVRYLEPAYNFFLRPHRPDNGDFSSAILLHFLDRPKPWDLSYRREYRALWIPHAGMVRALLRPADYNAIVAAANR